MSKICMPYVNPIYLRGNTRAAGESKDIPIMPGMPKKKLARAYIPRQPYVKPFPLDEALIKGTLFPNLYIPYPIKSKE